MVENVKTFSQVTVKDAVQIVEVIQLITSQQDQYKLPHIRIYTIIHIFAYKMIIYDYISFIL